MSSPGKRPDSGTAWFGDASILLQLSEPAIVAAGIGRKFQKPTVFEQLTVFENLELALAGSRSFLKNATRPYYARAKRESTRYSASSDSRNNARSGQNLAHGQKQWLEIGMLLMQNPELLLVDEPVAGMTPHEIERTSALLTSLAESTRLWSLSMTCTLFDRSPSESPCCTKAAHRGRRHGQSSERP